MKGKRLCAGAIAFVMVLSTISMGTCLAYSDGATESGVSYSGSFEAIGKKYIKMQSTTQ